MKTLVIAKLFVEGIHQWEGVLKHPELESVHFLAQPHRHIFHITVKKEVAHNDRDIEIITLKRNILEYLNMRYFTESANCLFFGNMSCEMIANELTTYFGLNVCEVLEDGENGAVILQATSDIPKTEYIIEIDTKDAGYTPEQQKYLDNLKLQQQSRSPESPRYKPKTKAEEDKLISEIDSKLEELSELDKSEAGYWSKTSSTNIKFHNKKIA